MKRVNLQKRSAILALGLCLAAGTATAAIEEVTVTAQKVSSNIQQTPIAMSAISGDALADRQIADVEGLMQSLPNVDFGVSLGTARLAIRGIGFDNIAGGNEGRIAFHEDGAYYSRPASVLTGFYDVERIEVLRGPQGTLYGRNATGGVVNVITRDPGSSPNGYFTVTGGNYDQVRTEGAVGGPLSDKFSGRIAFQTENRDGYGKNEVTGTAVDDKDTRAIRGKLRFDPTDDLRITLEGDLMKENDHANGYVFFQHYPISTPASALYPNPVSPQPLTGELFGGVSPVHARDTAGDTDTDNDRKFSGFNGTINYSFGSLDFTSITSVRRSNLTVVSDIDQTSLPIAVIQQDENSRQWSEEFRVQQNFDRGEWLLGAYYFNERLDTGNRVAENASILPFFRTWDPNVACPAGVPHTAPVPRRPCTAADLSANMVQGFGQYGFLDTKASALFGNLHYKLTDQWGARLGLRYSGENKAVDEVNSTNFTTSWPPFVSINPFPPAPPPAGPANTYRVQDTDKSYYSLTPTATVDYQYSGDLYLYATYSEGFKSGGFNIGGVQPAFDPEKIKDYEIGAKADWLDRRLRTNASIFYYDYKDIQANTIAGTQLVIFNVPGATVKGAEFEIEAAPIDELRLEANLAWLDSEYKGPFSTVDSARAWLGPIDITGNQLTQAPKRSANFAAQYTWTIPYGELTLRGETQYKDRVYFSVFNLSDVSQPAYWSSNAFLNFATNDKAWSASLFVRNIEDKLVRVAENVSPAFWGTPVYGAFAPPRTYGLELGYHFD